MRGRVSTRPCGFTPLENIAMYGAVTMKILILFRKGEV